MMKDLNGQSPAAIIASIETDLQAGTAKCPICGRALRVTQNAQASDFWMHFYSTSHAPYRLRDLGADEELALRLISFIKNAARRSSGAQRKAQEGAIAASARAAAGEQARREAHHPISGALLDEIAGEMRKLISMMDPYHIQGNGDANARRLIDRIESASRPDRAAASSRV